MSPDLRLHEAMLLLTLKDDKGTPRNSMYAYGLAGAILTELVLEERVRLEERGRRKPLVDTVSGTQIGDPVLDDALRAIRTARRRATPDTWISRWAKTATMHETARRLSRRGILRTTEKRVLLIFTRTVYPELDPAPERALIEGLRVAIFGDEAVDSRTAALVALADAVGLLAPVFGKKELKGRKERIQALAGGDAVAEATRSAIQAVQVAIIATTTAATAASAAS